MIIRLGTIKHILNNLREKQMKKVLYIILCMSFVASCNSKNEKTENYIIRNLKGIIREVSIIGSGKAGERTIFLKEEKMKFIKKIVFSNNTSERENKCYRHGR
jgi:hypothetical protein